MNKRNFKGWLYLLPAMLFLGNLRGRSVAEAFTSVKMRFFSHLGSPTSRFLWESVRRDLSPMRRERSAASLEAWK